MTEIKFSQSHTNNQADVESDREIERLNKTVANLKTELARRTAERDMILCIFSWRITSPIRIFIKERFPWSANQLRRVYKLVRLTVTQQIFGLLKKKVQSRINRALIKLRKQPVISRELAQKQYQRALHDFFATDTQLSLPSAAKPRLSVVIVLYNKAELTLVCLQSLAVHLPPDSESLIIDNASSDSTSQLLGKVSGARIIRNSENLHFLRACNQASDLAKGEYLLLLNNDAVLVAGAIDATFSAINSRPKVGAVGARIINLNGRLQEAGSIVWRDGTCLGYGRGDDPDEPEYRFRRPVDYVSGAFLMTPTALFREFGGFDEAFAPAYYEETDYCIRLWKKGYEVLYEPDAVIHHFEFGSSSGKSASALMQRNRTIFVEHHATYLVRQNVYDPARIIFARSHAQGPRILYIDDCVPRPKYGAGMPRACEIVRILASLGSVTIFPVLGANESWDEIYADVPKEVEVMRGLNLATLKQFLNDRKGYYDLLWVSRPHNMEYVQSIAQKLAFDLPPVVYDAEALSFLREQERVEIWQKELENLYFIKERERVAGIQKKMEGDELRLLANARLITAVSEIEAQHMRERGLENNILVLGHRLEIKPTPAPFAERSDFLFVGALNDINSPNGDSLLWFAREVWPLIRASLGDELRLNVVGYCPVPALLAGRLPEGIHLVGSVPDAELESWYNRSRVFIIPTRFAAGVPLKGYQAAAHGLPLVTTQLIASQLGWKDNHELLATPIEGIAFANACIRLYQDEVLWGKLRKNALQKLAVDTDLNTFNSTIKRALDMTLSK